MKPSGVSRRIVLMLVAAGVVAASLLLPRLAQDQAYHRMADERTILGVPNALNVFSNAAFLAVGLAGVGAILSGSISARAFAAPWERGPYLVLFAGTALTALGSTWYHLAPDDARLVWDRLPMTLGFMGLLAALLGERVSSAFAHAAFAPLVLLGAGSVVFWAVGGDLRLYAAVQFGSLLLILAMLVLFRPTLPGDGYLWAAAIAYGTAKASEAADRPVFNAGRIVSGHTLKHLLAAISVGLVVQMLRARSRSETRPVSAG